MLHFIIELAFAKIASVTESIENIVGIKEQFKEAYNSLGWCVDLWRDKWKQQKEFTGTEQEFVTFNSYRQRWRKDENESNAIFDFLNSTFADLVQELIDSSKFQVCEHKKCQRFYPVGYQFNDKWKLVKLKRLKKSEYNCCCRDHYKLLWDKNNPRKGKVS